MDDELCAMVIVLTTMAEESCCMKHGLRRCAIALLTTVRTHGYDVNEFLEFMRTTETTITSDINAPMPTEKVQ